MSAGFGTLTWEDCDLAFQRIVPRWMLEQLDVQMGTARCVESIRPRLSNSAFAGPAPDGPYSDGENAEWWTMAGEAERSGWRIRILRETRDDRPATVVREGVLPWNNIANRATIAACDVQRRVREAEPGEQMSLT